MSWNGYDALLLVSFGGPQAPGEVMDFLRQLTRGTRVSQQRLEEVAQHYHRLGGRSPINDLDRALLAAVSGECARRGLPIASYRGTRHWKPDLGQTLAQIHQDGRRRVLAWTTSAYPSYSGCRSYREALGAALVGSEGPPSRLHLSFVGPYANQPWFVQTMAEALAEAIQELSNQESSKRHATRILFVAHSLPAAMAAASGPPGQVGAYQSWLEQVMAQVVDQAQVSADYLLAYCSRSGRPDQPWLEPSVSQAIDESAQHGIEYIVLAPIGFLSDHTEVAYDLDIAAAQRCQERGIRMVRAATAGIRPRFVHGLVDHLLAAAQADLPLVGCAGKGCCLDPERAMGRAFGE